MEIKLMQASTLNPRSHALRGNALSDAPRHGTQERPNMGSHAEHGNQSNLNKANI